MNPFLLFRSSFLRFVFWSQALNILVFSISFGSTWSDEIKLKVDQNVGQHFRNGSQAGMVVGVIRDGESHIWSYGEKLLGSGLAPGADTYFEIGSITKTYTATLLAMEVVKGRVALKDPIEKFWPELKNTDAGQITFEQLASHTSGLPRMPSNFVEADPLNPYRDYDGALLFAFLKDFKSTGAGPFSHSYSNVGLGALGYILATKVNSTTWFEYLESNLLRPLKLYSTKSKLEAGDTDFAQGYDSFLNRIPFWDLNALEGAGALKVSARDLLRYLELNMNTDSSLIGRAMRLAQTQLFPSSAPGATVGLAWEEVKLGDRRVLTHSGATGGYRANLIFDQTEKIGAIVLSNSDSGSKCVLAPVFDQPCAVPVWAKVSPAIFSSLVGGYQSDAIGLRIDIFEEAGSLGIQPSGQPRMKVWAKSDYHYVLPGQAELKFLPPPTGPIDSFELHLDGQTVVFTRI